MKEGRKAEWHWRSIKESKCRWSPQSHLLWSVALQVGSALEPWRRLDLGKEREREEREKRESGGCSLKPNPVKWLSCFDALVSCYSQMVDLSPRKAVRFDYLEF